MPANTDSKKSILTALNNFEKKPLADAARGLLNTLGYQSARTLKITPNTAEGFQTMFSRQKQLKAEARLEDWLSVDFLFQVSEAEIQASLNGQGNFTAAKVDDKDIRSYLFFAVELKDQQYTRTQLSGITREINRLFDSIPALIVFKHGGMLSVGIIARRLSKKDNSKDVLEKVTIIKDISFASPHRAHVEILLDLSIGELQSRVGFSNFGELQKSWEQVLDTSALNKKFFKEVASWYFWAVDTVKFPKDAETQMSVIRLITRLIFVWFIKEKGLVPPELFDERKLQELLYFNDPQKSSYYKAILQNLFFATLNTIMGADRKFRSKNKNPNGLDGHHGVTTLYRYEDQFKAPKEALKLFANIPFLNGGLFECLDKSGEKIYIDGFSDTPKNQPVVPDELFFGAEQNFDLNEIYDTKNRKYKVRGLIHIFNDYKFTIEENTPIEEEIALDPELLGKVFENLLAAYNPETSSTARKQTGSFYTPREIVNYMVDEALIAYLESALMEKDESGTLRVKDEEGKNSSFILHNLSLQDRLRHLFAYNNQAPLFNEAETLKLIKAINNLKAFDPACGSGAFPMGMLHKLVFVLKKLDTDNSRWREFQISKVADFPELVAQVEDSFKNNNDDYGRKLYLIQNCIYGADIQPIAVQITKLRFFISLVVEQKVDDSKPNRGIQPLPNLETKFVAANTLIGIARPQQLMLHNPVIDEKEKQLDEARKRHFSARTPATKAKYREQDKKLRGELADLLKKDGWGSETAAQLAGWDPYDQNTHAEFFDAKWMFGIEGGFDVVIGNPPYSLVGSDKPDEQNYYKKVYKLTSYKINTYVLFIEKGLNLLKNSGSLLSYIIPKSLVFNTYFQSTREQLLRQYAISQIVEIQDEVFESAEVGNSILFFAGNSKDTSRNKLSYYRVKNVYPVWDVLEEYKTLQSELLKLSDKQFYKSTLGINSIRVPCKVLSELANISNGLNPGNVRDILLSDKKKTNKHQKMILGRDVQRYFLSWSGKWVNYDQSLKGKLTISDIKSKTGMTAQTKVDFALRNKEIYLPNKILVRKTADRIIAAYDEDGFYFDSLSYGIQIEESNKIKLLYILGLLNSKYINYLHDGLSLNKGKVFAKVLAFNLAKIPVRVIDFSNVDETFLHDQIASLTTKILTAKRADPQVETSKWEAEIDQLVYQLYELTEDEVKIVEGKG